MSAQPIMVARCSRCAGFHDVARDGGRFVLLPHTASEPGPCIGDGVDATVATVRECTADALTGMVALWMTALAEGNDAMAAATLADIAAGLDAGAKLLAEAQP